MGIGIAIECGARIWIQALKLKSCIFFKVVQEYERAVVFRLGRLPKGGDKGPGEKTMGRAYEVEPIGFFFFTFFDSKRVLTFICCLPTAKVAKRRR